MPQVISYIMVRSLSISRWRHLPIKPTGLVPCNYRIRHRLDFHRTGASSSLVSSPFIERIASEHSSSRRTRSNGDSCEHQTQAIRTICALAIAIVAIASLGILVSYDLHATRPEAEAAVYRAELRETMLYARWRRDQLDGEEALWVARSAWTSPSFRDTLDNPAGALSGSRSPARENGRAADFPAAPGPFSGAPSGTAAAPRFWPRSLASVGKHPHHHHHQEDSYTPEDSDESPHRRKRDEDPSTDSSETGTSETDEAHHTHEHKHKHRHPHPHHRHHAHDGTTSDSDESHSEEGRRRRSKKAAVDANVMSRQSAASSVASANAGDVVPTE